MSNAIVLPQALNINSVAKVMEGVRKAISVEDKIILDAKDVKEIDALGLQLILSIQKTGIMNNIRVELINVGEKLQRILFLSSMSK